MKRIKALWSRLFQLSRYSLGKKLLKRYLLLIFVPLLLSGLVLGGAFYQMTSGNRLYQQREYLRYIDTVWEEPVGQVETVRASLGGMPELERFLDPGYYTRGEQLYLYKKTMYTWLTYIVDSQRDVEHIRLYGWNDGILRLSYFGVVENIPLSGEELGRLTAMEPLAVYWKVQPGREGEKPTLYAYYKYYSSDYLHLLGYVEVRLRADFLDRYMDLLAHAGYSRAWFYVYGKNGSLVYQSGEPEADFLPAVLTEASYGRKGAYHFFRTVWPDYGLSSLVVIKNSELLSGTVGALALILLLLLTGLFFLSLLFCRDLSWLSRRIGDFSHYVREYDERSGELYAENPAYIYGGADEFSALIDAFREMTARNNTLSKKVMRLQLLNKDAELAAMQAQINPHFIYGTLETIRMLAIQNDDEEVEGLVCSFSKLMRYSLHHPSQEGRLSREMEIGRHYMEIQKIRFEDRIAFQCVAEEHLPDLICPPFILQPLLENAIVHGASQSLERCEIRLETLIENGAFVLRVANSGSTATPERVGEVNRVLSAALDGADIVQENKGFGLRNIAGRLELFYHGKATLRLCMEEDWLTAQITIAQGEWENYLCSDY